MMEEHARTRKTHHLTHSLAHIGFVAMDGAETAGALLFSKLAGRESLVAILEEGGAIVAKLRGGMMVVPAVDAHHLRDGLLFVFDAGHERLS